MKWQMTGWTTNADGALNVKMISGDLEHATLVLERGAFNPMRVGHIVHTIDHTTLEDVLTIDDVEDFMWSDASQQMTVTTFDEGANVINIDVDVITVLNELRKIK